MKLILTVFIALVSLPYIFSQKILLVDDSKDNFQNTIVLSDALAKLNREHDYFNAAEEISNPNLTGLLDYNIVIWHTSNDGLGLQFWEGMEKDNEILKAYLDAGKILWVIGNDFLYDRFATETSFESGSFVYDYLGISSYDVQSYQDDGGIGMPTAVPVTNAKIPGLKTLDWQFATLWNADGVTAVPGAELIYEMGSSSSYPNYTFEGRATGILNETPDFAVLSYFFDLSLASSNEVVQDNMEAVLSYFDGIISKNESISFQSDLVTISPNPVVETIQVKTDIEGDIQAKIYTSEGRFIQSILVRNQQGISVGDWSKGMYYIQFETSEGVQSQTFIKI